MRACVAGQGRPGIATLLVSSMDFGLTCHWVCVLEGGGGPAPELH